jgi:hypothetical protein
MKNETSVRILFRILFPFFINDHFPSGYSDALLTGDVEWVILGEKVGGNEEYDDDMLEKDNKSKRHSLQIAEEEEKMYR